MFYQNLEKLDSDFKVIRNESLSFSTISHYKEPVSGSLVIIGKEKFFKILLSFDEFNLGLIVDQNLYKDLDQSILDKFPFVAVTSNISLAICSLSHYFYENKKETNNVVDSRQMGTSEIDPTAVISQHVFFGENVKIGANVHIHSGVRIMSNTTIGDNSVIYPNVTIYENVTIGKNCRINSGTVIGADGFGYNFLNGKHEKVWHLHGVEVHDDVEIGSNVSIDCGAFRPTRIGEGTKIDNLVQIAHNVQIGKHNVLCGMSGLSGSVELGNYCVLGGKAALAPGVVLEDGCQVAGLAGVAPNSHWKKGSQIGGHPAQLLKDWMRGQVFVRQNSKRK